VSACRRGESPAALAAPVVALSLALTLALHGAALALHGCAPAPAPIPPAVACSDARVVLASQADVAALVRCSTLRSLVVRTGARLDLSGLRAPLAITGDLVIGPTVGLEELTLPGVRVVEATVRVVGNGLMQGLFLPGLERAGRIEIDGNVAVTTISLPRLATIAGALVVTDNASLEMLDLPALTSVDGELVVARNPKLSLLEAPQLRRAATVLLDAPALPDDVAAGLRATAGSRAPAR
jgi:hypothetical protein